MAESQCEALRRESEELCFLKRLKPAHNKAVEALQTATELFGKNTLQLVPFYLVLAEIALGERQLKQAEEVLSLVNWLLVKDRKQQQNGPSVAAAIAATSAGVSDVPEELTNLYVIRMNKLYSRLLMEYEAYPEALQRCAHGAYHCALLLGPEHLYTAEMYFWLGRIFSRMQSSPTQESENALGLFDKVVDIWYRFLTHPPEDTAAWMLEHQRLRIYEASSMLQHIAQTRARTLGAKHVATGEALYTQGLLFLFLEDHTQAKHFVQQALDVYVETMVRCLSIQFSSGATSNVALSLGPRASVDCGREERARAAARGWSLERRRRHSRDLAFAGHDLLEWVVCWEI